MNTRLCLRLVSLLWLVVACAASAPAPVRAQVWQSMGPPGGDALALSADPSDPAVLYLGTSDGHIFGSRDAGEHWQLLGRASNRLDAVVTAVLVDPRDARTLFASTWTRGTGAEGGGVFRSRDGGRSWQACGLAGHAVRALALAPSDAGVLIAGALDGVFRTRDAGAAWERISPEGRDELRNFDSLAIDPQAPEVIYAGTFHLPWKTADGGNHWAPIHAGMIDDSDVLSLIVDEKQPQRIYASACSGIYRSDTAGALWKKIQGIPFSARRTYVIRQDPAQPAVVYAGTSEGFWKTSDAGASWRRLTPSDWVIHTMVVAPPRADSQAGPGRIAIGTEKLGVLVSDDGGEHFRAANDGFNHRQIVSLALDRDQPGRVLVILANAPEPALATSDGGRTWTPLGPGLKTEGLRRVYASPDGWWATPERGGLLRYDAKKGAWDRAGFFLANPAAATERRGRKIVTGKPRPLDLLINDMAFSRDIWFAATPEGLIASRDRGATWSLFHFAALDLPVNSVRLSADGQKIRIVSLRGMVFSEDGGAHWTWHDLPFDAGGAVRLDLADEGTLVATAQKGLYLSRDGGRHWQLAAAGLPEVFVQDLALSGGAWLASMHTGGLYISYDRGASWSRIEGTLAEGFFPVVTTGETAGVVYAASNTEGLYLVQLEKRAGSPEGPNPAPSSLQASPSAGNFYAPGRRRKPATLLF